MFKAGNYKRLDSDSPMQAFFLVGPSIGMGALLSEKDGRWDSVFAVPITE
jgi:hypothetical protein